MEISISITVPDGADKTYIHGALCCAAQEALARMELHGKPNVDEQFDLSMPHGDSAIFFRTE